MLQTQHQIQSKDPSSNEFKRYNTRSRHNTAKGMKPILANSWLSFSWQRRFIPHSGRTGNASITSIIAAAIQLDCISQCNHLNMIAWYLEKDVLSCCFSNLLNNRHQWRAHQSKCSNVAANWYFLGDCCDIKKYPHSSVGLSWFVWKIKDKNWTEHSFMLARNEAKRLILLMLLLLSSFPSHTLMSRRM